MFVKGNLVRCKTSGVVGYITDIYSRQYPMVIHNSILITTWGSREAGDYRTETYLPCPFAKQIMVIDINTGKDYHAPYEQWEQYVDIKEGLL